MRKDRAGRAVGDHTRNNITVTLDHAEDLRLLSIVAPLSLPADPRFVDLDYVSAITAEREVTVHFAHIVANDEAHAPRSFVGDS